MKKDRKSNIELLGIVSMFMIVFSHVTWEGRFSYPKSITKNISKKIIPLTMGIYIVHPIIIKHIVYVVTIKNIYQVLAIYILILFISMCMTYYSKKDTGIK